jgi:hypothetical protein
MPATQNISIKLPVGVAREAKLRRGAKNAR